MVMPRSKIEAVARAICREWLAEAGEEMFRDGTLPPEAVAAAADATAFLVDETWPNHAKQAEAAIRAAGAAPLTRTDPPTEPGWYWGRWSSDQKPQPLAVRMNSAGNLVVEGTSPRLSPTAYSDWYGPIEIPQVQP